MERGMILWFAALVLSVAPRVKGTGHLTFDNMTQVNISREGCGVSKLCVEDPDDCDPAGTSNNNCSFLSVVSGSTMPPTNLSVQLRGNSPGYVALGLTANASEGSSMVFICAQNSSDNVTFRTMQRNNTDGTMEPQETRVTEIRGLEKDGVIRCEFTVLNVTGTNLFILQGIGSFDGNALGSFNVSKVTGRLNVADPGANVPTPPTPTPTAPATPTKTTLNNATANVTTPVVIVPTTILSPTSGASGVLHPQAPILLLIVPVLSII